MAMPAGDIENPKKKKVTDSALINWIHSQRFFTVPEIARGLKVSRMTIYRAIDKGELEVITVGTKKATQEQLANYLNIDPELFRHE